VPSIENIADDKTIDIELQVKKKIQVLIGKFKFLLANLGHLIHYYVLSCKYKERKNTASTDIPSSS